ncbi:MAG: molybdopterin-binding protein [Deltaproteobacteria bacterium]|nr:molybdopterin-binding protein [Deltaproteobacteria bacterium]MBW2304364.1 molybdopterin-binding protein [Deltaproteobacteria bacterium]
MADQYKSSATVISLEEAVGKVLAHDITEIRPGRFKGAAFKKGHILRVEDLEHLRRLGKEHLYVLHIGPGELHEDDAAVRLARALAGKGIVYTERPSEGKIALKAAHRGLLKVNVETLTEFNLVPSVTCASRHNNTVVEKGETIAATRVIPLVIDRSKVDRAVEVAGGAGGVFSVKPFATPETGLIITGNEVFTGRIDDQFAPILQKKLGDYHCPVKEIRILPDNRVKIKKAILEFLEKGLGLILVAGGMSVDPDDLTRLAIADAGAEDVVYGTPILPGAMFLYAHFGEVPVMGLPACVLYYGATVFDIMLPRVLAGEPITRHDLAAMAHGGLCLNCRQCRFPVCPFGK